MTDKVHTRDAHCHHNEHLKKEARASQSDNAVLEFRRRIFFLSVFTVGPGFFWENSIVVILSSFVAYITIEDNYIQRLGYGYLEHTRLSTHWITLGAQKPRFKGPRSIELDICIIA